MGGRWTKEKEETWGEGEGRAMYRQRGETSERKGRKSVGGREREETVGVVEESSWAKI